MRRRFWSGAATLGVGCSLLLAASAGAATLSAEFPVGTPNSVGSLSGETSATVACGSTTCMSVWVDFGSGGNSVRAGRVNSSGTPLDKPRLRVADAASSSAVSWNGSAYVLAWTTSRPAAGGGTEYVVQTRRMAQDATLGPIVDVATSASSLSQVTAASVGATTLIAWVSGGDIRGARVDGSGNVLDPAGIMICGVAGSQTNPNVGASDTQFLVAWSDSRTGTTVQDIYAARVGVDGTVLDPGGGAVSAAVDYQYGPHVGSDGSRFLVSWTDWRNSNSDVYGARVSSTAAVADPSGIAIRTTADPEIAGGVSESGGADVPTFIATWHQESAGGTTSSAGAVDISSKFGTLGTEFWIEADAGLGQTVPDVAERATGFAVIWHDANADGIKMKRYSAPGTTTDNAHGVLVSWGVNYQERPTISFDGTNYLFTWLDKTSEGLTADIRAARVQPDGTVLDPTGILVASGVPTSNQLVAAYGGTSHLIVWTNNGDIYARRVATNGTLPDAGPIAIATTVSFNESGPAVAGGGANGWFVAWTAGDQPSRDVRGTRVSAAGAVLDPPLGISVNGATDESLPGVGFNGTDYLVALHLAPGNIVGRRVTTAGSVGTQIPIGQNASSFGQPSIASDGSNWAVLWTGNGVFGQLVNSSGAKTGNQAYFGQNTGAMSFGYNGGQYVLATPQGTGTQLAFLDPTTLGGYLTTTTLANAQEAAIVHGPAGAMGVAYTRWADEAPYGGATRLFMKTAENYILRVSAPSVTEGQTISATVTLSPARPDRTVSVDYATGNGGATPGVDYQAKTGTLTFPPGVTQQTISVTTYDDNVDEDDINEYMGINLSNPANVEVYNAYWPVLISDNDPAPTLTLDNTSVNEAGGQATVDLHLSAISGRDVSVQLQASGISAGSLDYTLPNGVFETIPAGQDTASVNVPIVSDALDEADETFKLQVQSATGATYAPGTASTITIVDDDASPAVSVGAGQGLEEDSFTSPVSVPVTLSAVSGRTVTVSLATSDGTAIANAGDYTAAVGQTVTFNPGETTKNVSVSVAGDTVDEADETFNANLSAPANATLGTATAVVTIQDDDGPNVSVGDAGVVEGNSSSAQLSFPITLSGTSPQDVTGTCTTQDGTAQAGSDYTAASAAAFSVPTGASTGSFVVSVTGDNLDEADETLGLTCTVDRTGNLSDGQANGTITDDDTSTIGAVDATATEGLPATVHVQLSGPSTSPISVRVKTADGTASAPDDYGSVDQVVSFAAGETDKTVEVSTVSDTAVEPDETLGVVLSEAIGAAAVRDATVTIANDDTAPPQTGTTPGTGTTSGTDAPPGTGTTPETGSNPPPGSGTATTTGSGVVIAAGGLKADKRGRVRVTLKCPLTPGATACKGTLRLVTAAKVRFGGKRRVVTLGTSSFTIARGKSLQVVVKLGRKQLKLVRSLRMVRVVISAGSARRVVKLRSR